MKLTVTSRVRLPQPAAYAVLTDLDRVLRSARMPGARYAPAQRDGRGVRLATTTMLGMKLVYYETDLQWLAPESFAMRRVFERGPFRSIDIGLRVTARGIEESEVVTEVEVHPKGLIGAMAARALVLPRLRRAFGQLVLEAEVSRTAPAVRVPGEHMRVDERELKERHTSALEYPRASPAALEVLDETLRSAPDSEVKRLDLLTLAARRSVPTIEMVRTACYATRVGMLRLRWDVRCPNCRQRAETHADLRNLREGSHCEMCNLDFTASFEESVEAVFSPHEAIRAIADEDFCPVGPRYQPTRLVQMPLAPGNERSFTLNLRDGFYVLRPDQHDAGRQELIVAEAEGKTVAVRYEVLPTKRTSPPVTSGPGMVSVTLRNGTGSPQTLVIELFSAHHTWISAAMITALAEFRDLFAEQVLAPGVRLGVQHAAFVFTDLKASTAMYESLGDAAAFALVRRHFEVLDDLVRKHRGAVVKTIGDAVMAVFPRSADALAAAIAGRDAIGSFNTSQGADQRLILKAGVHAGPCLVVNLNDRLDYFGTTVNIAARVQAQSQGNDVVFTARLAEAPEVRQLLLSLPDTRTPYEAPLKGLKGTYALVRLAVGAANDSMARPSAGRPDAR